MRYTGSRAPFFIRRTIAVPAEAVAVAATAFIAAVSTAFCWWIRERTSSWAARTTVIPQWERYSAEYCFVWQNYWPAVTLMVFGLAYLIFRLTICVSPSKTE